MRTVSSAERAKSIEVLTQEIETQEAFVEFVSGVEDPAVQLQVPNLKSMLALTKKVRQVVKDDEPFVYSWFVLGPEIYHAMDLFWDSGPRAEFGTFLALSVPEYLEQVLKDCDRVAVSSDICTLHRLALSAIEMKRSPKPWAAVACIHPCDGVSQAQSAVERAWPDVPMFWMDSPYYPDERGVKFFAGQMRRMAKFLEEHTGKRLDLDKLRDVCNATNEQYALWGEFDALKRNRPCPVGSWAGYGIWNMMQNNPLTFGQPITTQYIKSLITDAEEKVAAGKGHLENEKVRVLFMDIAPVWFAEFAEMLEQECNGVVVVEGQGGSYAYTPIDTSTEESMFMGIARRNCMETPMIRTSRGPVDIIINDMIRNVLDYKIDVVIAPGHMGHKDMQASLKIIRDACETVGAKLLNFQYDLFDNRYMPMEEIRRIVTQFIDAMSEEKLI